MFGWRRNQEGPQQHAEGGHGEKTTESFIEFIHVPDEEPDAKPRGSAYGENPSDGKHRLAEHREQHDPAERHSESTRGESLSEAIARMKEKKR